MKIKRLEISGFKSFADKVTLDFQQGVTGVVGPNGCGKSNIVDAIRWCMGEQSAKHLRGKSMEDVIFAGSENRRSLGVAEVSLTFSTEDGRAPAKYLDYAEIQLTRRLYRDGESDYLINKTPCRLLDITELFMDTGVGTRAYSIIEQGKIGQILHSRPEERRFLIEEAAGVTKFKSRKQLALKKIESTRHNLLRLVDVLGEIRRQLSSLQRQAKKAEKFREHRDELRDIELLFTASEYRQVQQQRSTAERELAALNDRIREVFSSSAVSETRVEQARVGLLEAEKLLTVAQEEIYRIRSEFSTAENGLEFQRRELAGLESRLARLESESGELEQRLKECAEQRGLLELRRDTSAVESAGMADELLRAESDLTVQQQTEEELQRVLEGRRKELFDILSESAQFKNHQENARKRLANVSERQERQRREEIQQAERLMLSRRRAGELDSELSEATINRESCAVELGKLRSSEDELKKKLPEQEKLWQSRRDELSRAASRLHSLKELEAQFAGYDSGVKNLMTAPQLQSGFNGLLADAIETAPELETAVEAALADRLQCIICAGEAEALGSLAFLKEQNGGRAGLALPLKPTLQPAHSITGATALADHVKLTGPCSGLIRHLLGSVMLVDNIELAVKLAGKHPTLSFVTPGGDMASQGGIVTGGSTDQAHKGIIHKKREIKELDTQLAVLEREVAELGREREELRQKSHETAEGLKDAGGRLHQYEIKLAGLHKDRQQSADEITRIEERQAVQAMESADLIEEGKSLESELTLAGERLAATGSASLELEQNIDRLKSELDSRRSELATVRERVTMLRVQGATLREQHEAHLRALSELERQSQDLTRRMTGDREDTQKGSDERLLLQTAISEGSKRLEALLHQQVTAETRMVDVRSAYEKAGAELTVAETQERQVREESDAVRQSQSELSLRFSTLSMQAELLEQGLLEKSRIPMSDALARLDAAEFDEAERRTRQRDLQRLLDELGEVNLMAIDEYAGMEERFTFLSAQKEDLEDSLKGLQQAIQRINRTTRQRFQETYDLVNAKFQEVFPRLFCGGQAELRLTNEEDLLETGIDIIVQPPGKKLQNVTLLSGGEKALTAVALIFSIFLIKPTPFCLLDEVDAPLDDANIGRFNEMVREMCEISQFIIITHNKATMQVADTLYGITMEEPGASKVVSVRLH